MICHRPDGRLPRHPLKFLLSFPRWLSVAPFLYNKIPRKNAFAVLVQAVDAHASTLADAGECQSWRSTGD
jgi:hypothetical protein